MIDADARPDRETGFPASGNICHHYFTGPAPPR
jgi:hypothetical protein